MGRYRYKAVLAGSDFLALLISGFIGIYLRFDGWNRPDYSLAWIRYMLIAFPLFFLVYYHFGLYSRVWKYASVDDLLNIAGAVSVATFTLFLVMWYGPADSMPRTVLLFCWFFNMVAVGTSRFSLRMITAMKRRTGKGIGNRRAIVIGAGEAGRMLTEEVGRHPELGLRILGFLDDDSRKIGMHVSGYPVLGSTAILGELVPAQNLTEVIIAMPSAPTRKIRELVQRCAALGVKVKTVPGLYRVLRSGVHLSELREVQIEDLLPRPEIKTDVQAVTAYLAGKTILITGAGGSIGSELSRQVAQFGVGQLLLLGHGENSIFDIQREIIRDFPALKVHPIIADVQDRARINHVLSLYQPHVVFHAAAHKHVPLMEYNPGEALKNNVIGTRNVAEAAIKYACERFVLVSTDKAVNPTSVMGATKRIAELVVQGISRQTSTKFMSVRFGNVLGSRGSVIPLFKEQIARGGPVTVTHPDMTRYFMTIPEAVSLIIQAGALGQGGEVFVLDMGEPIRIMDLARDLIILSGLQPDRDIQIELTGVRPGEKLFEELLTADESMASTQHKHILISRQSAIPHGYLERALEDIEELIVNGCDAAQVLHTARVLSDLAHNGAATTRDQQEQPTMKECEV